MAHSIGRLSAADGVREGVGVPTLSSDPGPGVGKVE